MVWVCVLFPDGAGGEWDGRAGDAAAQVCVFVFEAAAVYFPR